MGRTIFLIFSTLFLWVNQSIVCAPMPDKCVTGKGKIVTESRDISGFTQVKVLGSVDVEIISGDVYSVEVTDYENLLSHLNTKLQGDKLEIGFEGCIRNSRAQVKITMPQLKGIYTLGSGDVKVSGDFTSDDVIIESLGSGDIIFNALVDGAQDVNVTLKGSGNLRFNTVAQSLNFAVSSFGSGNAVVNLPGKVSNLVIKLAGSGDLQIKGDTADKAQIIILGSGDCDAQNIVVKDATIKLMGSGDAHLNVEQSLVANIMGSGDVYYHGNPGNLLINKMGSGDVIKK